MILKHRLKYAREFRGLTQAQLADMAHLSLSHYSRLERGIKYPYGPSALTAALLCKALHLRFEDIFYLEDKNA